MPEHVQFRYASDAPCAICLMQAPDSHTNVSFSRRFNTSYVMKWELTVPVCTGCRERNEAPDILGLRRMMVGIKVSKWLRTYQLLSEEEQARATQTECSRNARWGWLMTVVSSVMIFGTVGAYFFPSPEDVQKSQQMPLAGFMVGMSIFGSILCCGMWLIRKSHAGRR